MTDEPTPTPTPTPTPAAEARAAEAAAIRRRWITLGEVLAVVAVLISGLTLWNSWSERRDDQTEKASEAQKASARSATLTLNAEITSGGLSLRPASADQTIQGQTIRFPTPLGIDPVETTGESRIEGDWFATALKRQREKVGLPDNSRGDERLPVVIETRFLVDGEERQSLALYDVGYTVEGKMLGGHSVTLRGLSLVSRPSGAKAETALDARWGKLFPEKK